jgi:hypothetical protein
MSKIFIASKPVYAGLPIPVNTGADHLYLVYDADGNMNTVDDQRVIRGGINSNMDTNI